MNYFKKSCPHCGSVYERYSQYSPYRKKSYGCSLRKCSKCNNMFIDKDVIEKASETREEILARDKLSSLLFFGIGIVLLIICFNNYNSILTLDLV